jgi:hypothetical protein
VHHRTLLPVHGWPDGGCLVIVGLLEHERFPTTCRPFESAPAQPVAVEAPVRRTVARPTAYAAGSPSSPAHLRGSAARRPPGRSAHLHLPAGNRPGHIDLPAAEPDQRVRCSPSGGVAADGGSIRSRRPGRTPLSSASHRRRSSSGSRRLRPPTVPDPSPIRSLLPRSRQRRPGIRWPPGRWRCAGRVGQGEIRHRPDLEPQARVGAPATSIMPGDRSIPNASRSSPRRCAVRWPGPQPTSVTGPRHLCRQARRKAPARLVRTAVPSVPCGRARHSCRQPGRRNCGYRTATGR